MKKNEVIKSVKTKAEEAGVKISAKDIEVVTTALYDTIVEAVKSGDSVKFNEVTYSVKEVPERSGVSKLGGVEKAWVKPAHKEVNIKASKTLKNVVQ